MTIAEVAEIYTAEQSQAKSRAWKYFRNQFVERWGEHHIEDLTPRDIRAWIRDEQAKGSTEQTIHCKAATLRAMFKIAEEDGLKVQFPSKVLSRIKIDNERVRYLSGKEAMALQAVLSKGDWAIVEFTRMTGLRTQELFSLRKENVNLSTGLITVHSSKTGKTRRVPIARKCRPVVKNLMKSSVSEYLINPKFPRSNSRQGLADLWKRNVWRPALRAAGIKDFRFHDLRHDFASALVKKNVSLYKVQKLLDHSTPRMTQRYAHLADDDLKQAVNLL